MTTSSKKDLYIHSAGELNYIDVLHTHTLSDVRRLIAEEFDPEQLPENGNQFSFRVNKIRFSEKQECRKLAFDLIDKGAKIELIPRRGIKRALEEVGGGDELKGKRVKSGDVIVTPPEAKEGEGLGHDNSVYALGGKREDIARTVEPLNLDDKFAKKNNVSVVNTGSEFSLTLKEAAAGDVNVIKAQGKSCPLSSLGRILTKNSNCDPLDMAMAKMVGIAKKPKPQQKSDALDPLSEPSGGFTKASYLAVTKTSDKSTTDPASTAVNKAVVDEKTNCVSGDVTSMEASDKSEKIAHDTNEHHQQQSLVQQQKIQRNMARQVQHEPQPPYKQQSVPKQQNNPIPRAKAAVREAAALRNHAMVEGASKTLIDNSKLVARVCHTKDRERKIMRQDQNHSGVVCRMEAIVDNRISTGKVCDRVCVVKISSGWWPAFKFSSHWDLITSLNSDFARNGTSINLNMLKGKFTILWRRMKNDAKIGDNERPALAYLVGRGNQNPLVLLPKSEPDLVGEFHIYYDEMIKGPKQLRAAAELMLKRVELEVQSSLDIEISENAASGVEAEKFDSLEEANQLAYEAFTNRKKKALKREVKKKNKMNSDHSVEEVVKYHNNEPISPLKFSEDGDSLSIENSSRVGVPRSSRVSKVTLRSIPRKTIMVTQKKKQIKHSFKNAKLSWQHSLSNTSGFCFEPESTRKIAKDFYAHTSTPETKNTDLSPAKQPTSKKPNTSKRESWVSFEAHF